MKVLVYFSFVMLLILLFVRCRSSEEIVKFKPYTAKYYMTKEIKVYEVKEWLYPILDSVVMKTEETLICQRFEYNAITNNCADAVKTIIKKGTGVSLPMGLSPKPNENFKEIKKNLEDTQSKINKKIEDEK